MSGPLLALVAADALGVIGILELRLRPGRLGVNAWKYQEKGEFVDFGGEYRRSWGQGALPAGGDFAGDKIDLGGSSLRAGVTINLDRKKKK